MCDTDYTFQPFIKAYLTSKYKNSVMSNFWIKNDIKLAHHIIVSWTFLSVDIDDSSVLTQCGRVTHVCVGKLAIIGSDNGLSPGRRQAIIWTNAGILLIELLGTNFSEILVRIQAFSFKKMHLKMSSAKWRPFCLSLKVLTQCCLMTPNHYPDQCWFIIKGVLWHSSENNSTRSAQELILWHMFKITLLKLPPYQPKANKLIYVWEYFFIKTSFCAELFWKEI